MRGESLKGHLDLLILACVEGGAAHGYAIIEELKRKSAGEFDLPEGTVYPVLHRLERGGLLKSKWSEANGRRRRLYSMNSRGRRALADRRGEWRSFVQAVTRVVGRAHS